MRVRAAGARGAAVVAILATALALSACGGASARGTNGNQIRDVSATVPATALGLAVTREYIRPTLVKAVNTYVAAAGLYSMRRNDVVEATLQISEFNSRADEASAKFRRALVALIGGSTPEGVRVGNRTVYLTTGSKQQIYVWFAGHRFYVLLVRSDYETPRGLLRSVMERVA